MYLFNSNFIIINLKKVKKFEDKLYLFINPSIELIISSSP